LRPERFFNSRSRATDAASSTSVVSNIYPLTLPAVTFSAPSAVAATATNDTVINVTWTNNASQADGDEIWVNTNGAGFVYLGDVPFYQAKSLNITNLSPGTPYQVKLRSYQLPATGTTRLYTGYSNVASVTTRDAFTSPSYIEFDVTNNNAYTYQATTTTGATRTSWNAATGLPTGMTFSTSTGAITGTPTQFGVFTATLSASFTGGWTATWPVKLRVARPPAVPIVGTAISAQTLTAGGNAAVSLTNAFSDPDSESAVKVTTNLGEMDFILFNNEAPATVTNFMSYVNAATNNFNNSVIHRAIPGFIVQGGAFKVSGPPNSFTSTPTTASPVNEPGISNKATTVSMAKVGGNPSSATNQFFVNLVDNASNLDGQNGGFTVFARVAGAGLNVANAISNLPNPTDPTVTLDGTSTTTLTNWPLTSASAAMDTTKVVTITSVATEPVLSYSVTGNTNPTVATTTISGTNAQINALAGGTTSVTVTATDLDGNTVSQTVPITVNQAPAFTNGPPTTTGVVGTLYSFTCTASGYPAPTFTKTAGTLPTGLTLTAAGVLSGTPTATGTFTGTITASNGIGTAATQNFSITIDQTLSNWASDFNLSGSDALPSADSDHDGHTNLEEFALMTNPTITNTTAVPSYVLAAPGATKFGEITFPVRKLAPSLTYTVEASTDLVSGSWSTLWTSADGFSASVISLAVDLTDRTVLTVRDTQPSPPATRRFLRVKISQP
jgi:cyclophilin family peptidyl-prolyl cis-trans isomerase